jgi:inner membrane transporter RhtA
MERVAVPDGAQAQAVGAPGGHAALDRLPPWTLTVSAATSIQFGAALATTIFDDIGPSATSLLRLALASMLLLLIFRPRPRAYTRADLRLAALFGLALGLMNLTFYLALDRIPLGIAVTLEFIGPLTVAVLASRRRLDLVWAALAALGIVLLAGVGADGDGLDPLGVFFVLCAAACWGIYIVLGQRAGKIFAGGSGLALASVVTALVPLVPGVVEGGADLLDPRLLGIGLAVALLSSVIPYTLEFEALRRLPANVFGVLMSLEPAIAALAGFVVLGQDLAGREVIAMACVVAASVGVTLAAGPRTVVPPEV